MEEKKTSAVVLLSGGADSAIALAWARMEYGAVHAFSVDYGQKHARELEAAVLIAKHLRVPHRTASLRMDLGGSLTSDDTSHAESIGASTAMVPGRNAILLDMAAAYAVKVGADTVVIGACGADAGGFPDCRPEFLVAQRRSMSLAMGAPIQLVAPLLVMTKAATLTLARTLPKAWDALGMSWSCYLGGERPCGECGACVARAKGFADAGETDPALVAKEAA
jgi:7-cyano-7-deazaguanine synthase